MRRLSLEATMEAAIRPKGVILKYKKLIREASRDENTLIELEDQLRRIKLEEARLEDPWELITKPVLRPGAIEPNKPLILLIGILTGLVSGVGYSLYVEKKSGLIFEKKYLEELLEINITDIFDLKSKKFNFYDLQILFNEIIKIDNKNNIRFISIGNLLQSDLAIFKKFIDQYLENKVDLEINSKLLLLMIYHQ